MPASTNAIGKKEEEGGWWPEEVVRVVGCDPPELPGEGRGVQTMVLVAAAAEKVFQEGFWGGRLARPCYK